MRDSWRPLAWMAVGLVACAGAAGPAGAADFIASSTFDTSAEGWRLVSTLGYDGPASHSTTGGNPGGLIYGQDPDTGAFGFGASDDYLGDISDAYGDELTFDVAAYQLPDQPTSWVGMRGVNGLELICTYPSPTSVYPSWHSRSIGMTEGAGWVRVSDGLPPTYGQFTSVLDNLDDMVILTEFVEGLDTDISGLDNIVLTPEPTTLSLAALGFATALLRRRRSPSRAK